MKISLCFYIEKGIFATGVVIVEIEREQFRYGVVVVSIWVVVVVVKNEVFIFFIKNWLLLLGMFYG